VANSGRLALRYAAAEPRPDLILLDVMMPEMDGYQVIAQLREKPATKDIPVMFLTALGDADQVVHGLLLGAVDYITKPIQHAVVRARLKIQLQA
jgi:putative two-component system response regulator